MEQHNSVVVLVVSISWSYHTADAAISLHNTLSIHITRVVLTVGAQPFTMAAPHLVTCEAGFTLSTAEGALVKTAVRNMGTLLQEETVHRLHLSYNSVVAVWVGSAASIHRWTQTLIYVITYLGGTVNVGCISYQWLHVLYQLCYMSVPVCVFWHMTLPLHLFQVLSTPEGIFHSESQEQCLHTGHRWSMG